MSRAFRKYSTITLKGKHLGSYCSRSKSSSIVFTQWNSDFFGPNNVPDHHRPVLIKYFAEQSVVVNGLTQRHILFAANSMWFKHRPDKDVFGKPVTIWDHDLYEPFGCHSIIPVQMIQTRSASLIDQLNTGESVLLTTPCIEF